MTKVSKKAGEMWSKIDSDTKERFEKKARAAKEKYEEEYKVTWMVLTLMVDCLLLCF